MINTLETFLLPTEQMVDIRFQRDKLPRWLRLPESPKPIKSVGTDAHLVIV